jgi:hypothetical protein
MPRQSLVRLGLACILAAAALPAFAQRQRGDESWGKPGVSFLQYRTDAVECAYRVGQEAPVEYPLVDLVFVDNMPLPNPDDAAANMQAAIDAEKPRLSRPWREISGQLQPALAKCLDARGYRRFRLTKDQTLGLKALPPGSRARQIYLWNLAVAPENQNRQTIRR